MSTQLEAVTLLERYGTPTRRASCPPASAALVYSGVPKAGAPERMSTFEVKPPYSTGAPGEAICDSASMASASACCCTSAPARVTGLMAPESVKGVIATGWPARPIASSASHIGISSRSGELELMMVSVTGVAFISARPRP